MNESHCRKTNTVFGIDAEISREMDTHRSTIVENKTKSL